MNKEEYWNNFLQSINSKLSSISFNIWFKDAKLVDIKDGTLIIMVSSVYIKDHINSYYEEIIEETIKETSNSSYTFEIITQDEVRHEEPVVIEQPIESPSYRNNNSNLNPKYTFDNFVIGETNRLAATIGLSVAEQPKLK